MYYTCTYEEKNDWSYQTNKPKRLFIENSGQMLNLITTEWYKPYFSRETRLIRDANYSVHKSFWDEIQRSHYHTLKRVLWLTVTRRTHKGGVTYRVKRKNLLVFVILSHNLCEHTKSFNHWIALMMFWYKAKE